MFANCMPQTKPVVPGMGMPIRSSRIGTCFYHQDLPAVYVCNRCGRPICRDCAKSYSGLTLCPQCYSFAIPKTAPIYPPFAIYR